MGERKNVAAKLGFFLFLSLCMPPCIGNFLCQCKLYVIIVPKVNMGQLKIRVALDDTALYVLIMILGFYSVVIA